MAGKDKDYKKMLVESKNLILRGAPGTGKSYLAKEIAADIISDGRVKDYAQLTDEEKEQVEFVQFHPGYDYSDFVEGIRPKLDNENKMYFKLVDGIFKLFVDRARKNYEHYYKPLEEIEREDLADQAITEFFNDDEILERKFQNKRGNEFQIQSIDDKTIRLLIPKNEIAKEVKVEIADIKKMLVSGKKFEKNQEVAAFFRRRNVTQDDTYLLVFYSKIWKIQNDIKINTISKTRVLKKYIFIIDEINRGEISKIFGELFFSIDPGYRGKAGEISTQYSYMHDDPEEKFYIPDNLYIIGTMNDIDRSVDSFDFAMRRRFRFVEITPEDRKEMLDKLGDKELIDEASDRMEALNKKIVEVEDLNENYQIGASYFLKLQTLNFDQLWTDCLKPLLKDYIQGMYEEKAIMKGFEDAYKKKNTKKLSSLPIAHSQISTI